MRLIDELRRRHVFRVAAWYATAAWGLIQVASTIFPEFDVPAWVMRAIIIAAVGGFPVALLLAWAFQLTKSGIRLETPDSAGSLPGAAHGLVSIVLAVAAGALLTIGAITGWRALDRPPQKPGIAVLDFDVLGQTANTALAGGLQEAVLDELSHFSNLRVIARTSTLRFSAAKPDIREVGRILDVPYVLEGSVQRQGGKLRVYAQLINAANNEHVWSRTYDRRANDIFGVQTALARDIAERLRVTLLPAERARAGAPPTTVPAAYEHYLQGLTEFDHYENLLGETGLPSLRTALAELDEALKLDSKFALAYAERARMLMELWFQFADSQPDAADAREKALLSVTQALQLAPDLGEAHRALGLYYYWGHLDYSKAERELELAQSLLPNDSMTTAILGFLRRRQNRFAESIDLLHEAYRLDPGNIRARENYALELMRYGRYREADAAMKDMLERFPKARDPSFGRAYIWFCRTGDSRKLRAAADAGLSDSAMEAYTRWLAATYEGQLDEALEVVSNAGGNDFGLYPGGRSLALAESYYLVGKRALAASVATTIISRIDGERHAGPDPYAGLAEAYLFAGRTDDARRAAKLRLESTPLKLDALDYWVARNQLAKVYAMLGDADEALQLLANVQHGPYRDYCGRELRVEPMFAPLRDDPRFKRLAAESDWK